MLQIHTPTLHLFLWKTQLPHSGLGFPGRGGEQLFDAAAFGRRGGKKPLENVKTYRNLRGK